MSEKTKQVQRLMLASQTHVHEGNVDLIPDFSELEGDFLGDAILSGFAGLFVAFSVLNHQYFPSMNLHC